MYPKLDVTKFDWHPVGLTMKSLGEVRLLNSGRQKAIHRRSPQTSTSTSTMAPPTWLNHPLFNVASFLILGQLAKRLNLENPDNLFYARATYLCAQATVIGLAYWLMSIVDKKNGSSDGFTTLNMRTAFNTTCFNY